MTALILVDTNVILYSRDGRFPAKAERCAAWLKALVTARCLITSPQVAAEHQINAQGKLRESQADAARSTRFLLQFCGPPTGPAIVSRALMIEARWRTNWWDSMLLAYAAETSCTHLLTEDAHSAPVIEGVQLIDPSFCRRKTCWARLESIP